MCLRLLFQFFGYFTVTVEEEYKFYNLGVQIEEYILCQTNHFPELRLIAKSSEDVSVCVYLDYLFPPLTRVFESLGGESGSKYRQKVRSHVANLGDLKNVSLRQQVLAGNISPQQLAVMTTQV